MSFPQFTAEAALGRTMASYTNRSFSFGRHGTSKLIPQTTCVFRCSPDHCICSYCCYTGIEDPVCTYWNFCGDGGTPSPY
jgi:hypothetical protein